MAETYSYRGAEPTKIAWTHQVLPDGLHLPGLTVAWWLGCTEAAHPTKPGAIDPACAHCYAKDFMRVNAPLVPRKDPGEGGVGKAVYDAHQQRKAIKAELKVQGRKPTAVESDQLKVVPNWGDQPRGLVSRRTVEAKIRALNRAAQDTGYAPRVFALSMADICEDNRELSMVRRRAFLDMRDNPAIDWLILTKRPENLHLFAPWGMEEWPSNIWVGTTASTQEIYEARAPYMQPFADRGIRTYLSVEPQYGPVTLKSDTWLPDWVLVGSVQTTKKCRPTRVEWVEDLIKQCEAADVPVFVKQLQVPGARAGRVTQSPEVFGRQWKQTPVPRRVNAMQDNVLPFAGGLSDGEELPGSEATKKPAGKKGKKPKAESKKADPKPDPVEITSIPTPSGKPGRPKSQDTKEAAVIAGQAIADLATKIESLSAQIEMPFLRPGAADPGAHPEICDLANKLSAARVLKTALAGFEKEAGDTLLELMDEAGVTSAQVFTADVRRRWMVVEEKRKVKTKNETEAGNDTEDVEAAEG
jgi:protein gp37